MKTCITLVCLLLIAESSFTQTNTFPSSGNVGIGTTSPATKLNVVSNTGSPGDFNGYPGYTISSVWPKARVPEAIFEHPNSGTSIGAQYTYRGGLGLGHGVGIYSVNPNPAGSFYYGDIRFHTTYWNGSDYTNVDRMVIDMSGNVGIGTTLPSAPLHIAYDDNRYIKVIPNAGIYSQSNDDQYNPLVISKKGNGDLIFKTGVSSNYDERLRIGADGNIGIGTTNPGPYKLAVEGTVGARKFKVTQVTPWADYVFDPSYELTPLSQVEAFIKLNRRLPDVPSGKEVKENGIDVGENQALLLKKIEELTLYLIEQQKRIEALEKQVKQK